MKLERRYNRTIAVVFVQANMRGMNMRVIGLTLVAVASLVASASARSAGLTEQDINLMAATAKAVTVYKSEGVVGMNAAVTSCYKAVRTKRKLTPRSLEYCIALDASSAYVDASVAEESGFPRSAPFTDEEVSARIHRALVDDGASKNANETRRYLDQRIERINRYTESAMTSQ